MDTSFKRLFGSDPNKKFLINLLNAIFDGRKTLIDLEYNKNEHYGVNNEDGAAIFDLLCTSNNGEKIIVEIQHSEPVNFKKRSIFYTSRLISEQAPKGKMADWKYEISEVYFIALIDQKEPVHTKDKIGVEGRYLHYVSLCYPETGEIFYQDLGYIYVDLTNFGKKDEECSTNLDRWLYELKHMPERENCPPHLKGTIYETFYHLGEYARLTREERKMYDQELKRKWDNAAVLANAEQKAQARGEEIGEIRGKHESRVEIARKLRSKGITTDEIAELTGLPAEELEKI